LTNSKEKIDWTEKFKELLNNHVEEERKREFIVKYFAFTKRMNIEIQPSDVEIIYKEAFK